MKSLHRPVFILGPHKSGSSLLRSLLDGHSDLFVVPTELHFFHAAGLPINYALRRAWPVDPDVTCLRTRLLRVLSMQSEEQNPFGDSPDFGGFDLAAAAAALNELSSTDLREAMTRYVHAVSAGIDGPRDLSGRRVVEKSVENIEFAETLATMFPDAQFIAIVRNPYANLVSLRRYLGRSGSYPSLHRPLRALTSSHLTLERVRRVLGRRVMTLRYEDLVVHLPETTTAIANFLDVTNTPSLQRPTSLGLPWQSNTTRATGVREVDPSLVNRWQREVTPNEIALVNRALAFVCEQHDYEMLRTPWLGARLRPARRESPRRWLANRVLYWMQPAPIDFA